MLLEEHGFFARQSEGPLCQRSRIKLYKGGRENGSQEGKGKTLSAEALEKQGLTWEQLGVVQCTRNPH